MREVKKCICHNRLVIYFFELIQPLATMKCLEQMFEKLKEGIVTKFKEKFI